ncbi:MAG: hypothetical protein LUF90_02150 [Rikenellaceae bacterium]|nr:hypothetical protein [Rikenellaceae bacterium]
MGNINENKNIVDNEELLNTINEIGSRLDNVDCDCEDMDISDKEKETRG